MGIMDVLEELSGPEYEEMAPQERSLPKELPDELPDMLPAPEQEDAVPLDIWEEVPEAKPQRSRIRPELVMAVLAVLAGLLLLVMVLVCMPYFNAPDEDPEALLHRDEAWATEPHHQEILEPTVSETEPPIPTIPPDTNPYGSHDFQYNGSNYLLLQNVQSWAGVDVSAYQGDIDWKAVKASGIDFAIIRLGYRGYESGKLVEDEYARKNLEEAAEAGLRVGAYFFSQALNKKEADEELLFMLDILEDYYLEMPLVLDWEIPTSSARTARMDARTLTDIQLHFCQKAEELGYQPMVYFNWHQSEHLYYLSELEEYPFWLALYQDRMTYPWRIEMWQYTSSGKVPGISGGVDINVYMPY